MAGSYAECQHHLKQWIGYWRFRRWLALHGACQQARDYVATYRDLEQCLQDCNRVDWLFWLLSQLDPTYHLKVDPYDEMMHMHIKLRRDLTMLARKRNWIIY